VNKHLEYLLDESDCSNIQAESFLYYFLEQQLFFRKQKEKKTKKIKNLMKILFGHNDSDLQFGHLYDGKVDKDGIYESSLEDFEDFLNKKEIYKLKEIKEFLIKLLQKNIDLTIEVFVSPSEDLTKEMRNLIKKRKVIGILL
jgi:hypothetical protein